MKVCGVIAEFNPFHQGHAYLLEQARKQTGTDVMVVVMSGNWVQRGEPAIEQKWSRAKAALEMVGFTDIMVTADFGRSQVQETSPRWFFQAVK